MAGENSVDLHGKACARDTVQFIHDSVHVLPRVAASQCASEARRGSWGLPSSVAALSVRDRQARALLSGQATRLLSGGRFASQSWQSQDSPIRGHRPLYLADGRIDRTCRRKGSYRAACLQAGITSFISSMTLVTATVCRLGRSFSMQVGQADSTDWQLPEDVVVLLHMRRKRAT